MKRLEAKKKPAKGKRFRVSITDDQGNTVFRDVNNETNIGLAAKQLIPALMEKQKHGEAVPEEKK